MTGTEEVTAARRRFDELKAKGFVAFKLNKSGGQGEQIDGFDPTLERVIMVPPFVGG